MVLCVCSTDQQPLYHLGTLEKCRFLGLALDLLSQKLWGAGSGGGASPAGDSEAQLVLGSTSGTLNSLLQSGKHFKGQSPVNHIP